MIQTAFLDANVVVYAGGRAHPLKQPSVRVLEAVTAHPASFVTSAEVLQELVHRYVALRIWDSAGRSIFEEFALLMRDRIEPIFAADVERAADLLDDYSTLSARDLLHLSTMERLGVNAIITADRQFDGVPGITRLDPATVDDWAGDLVAGQGETQA